MCGIRRRNRMWWKGVHQVLSLDRDVCTGVVRCTYHPETKHICRGTNHDVEATLTWCSVRVETVTGSATAWLTYHVHVRRIPSWTEPALFKCRRCILITNVYSLQRFSFGTQGLDAFEASAIYYWHTSARLILCIGIRCITLLEKLTFVLRSFETRFGTEFK